MSIEMARVAKEGSERRSFIVGRVRESSSSGETWGARGRVDWPPMSRTMTGLEVARYALIVGRSFDGSVLE